MIGYIALYVVLGCFVAIGVSLHADARRHDKQIAWLHEDNTRLRAGLRSLGVDVPTEGEPASGEGRHAAKSVQAATIPLSRPQSVAEPSDHLDTRTTGATSLLQAMQTDDDGKGAA